MLFEVKGPATPETNSLSLHTCLADDEDDDDGAYSDTVSVNLSTSLSVMILSPLEWWSSSF